jgi:(R)-2-hydroxyacyl-CoA dehydratese activating ATPase
MSRFLGIDIGASAAKGVLLDADRQIVGTALVPSGIHFSKAADTVIQELLDATQTDPSDIRCKVACGYGRRNVAQADATRTEIACHAKGAFHFVGAPVTVLDIGAQDTKRIQVNDTGEVDDFSMNRKCASGTGAFLEEMARRIRVPVDKMNDLAECAGHAARIGAFCTVFAASELLAAAREGAPASAIALGIYTAMVDRAVDAVGTADSLVVTGGVAANNPVFCRLLKSKTKGRLSVPPFPQYTGAVGAALFATELAVSDSLGRKP